MSDLPLDAQKIGKGRCPFFSEQQRLWLEHQFAFGVDVAVAEQPYDYCQVPQKTHSEPVAEATTEPSAIAKPKPKAVPKAAPKPPPTTALSRTRIEAEAIAAQADNLEELKEAVRQFDGCPLKATASNLVFGAGAHQPAVMIIGEGPGSEEDRQGEPFVGASGRLMLRALEVIGIRRTDNLYISNVVYWRPPADRTPNDTEVATCLPFLCRQISLVQPKLIVLVGARAAQSLLGTSSGITRIRGSWSSLAPGLIPEDIPALPMFHPAYLFRNHGQKRLFWHDILALRTRIDALGLDVPWPESGLQGFHEGWKP